MTLAITIKTLQQKQFKIDAEPTDTIAQLKEKIQEQHGSPVANQKLIYAGKILADTKTIGECEIKEKDFLVLMVAKPKATAGASTSGAGASITASSTQKPADAAPTPATGSTAPPPDQVPPAPVPAPAEPAIQPPATTEVTSVPEGAAPAFGDMGSFLTGSALQTSIQGMVEMGFPRDQVMAAMRASYNNPDRAVEYLMNGIPEHLVAESSQAPAARGPAPPATGAPPAAPSAPVVSAPQAQAPVQPGNLFQAAQQAAQQQATGHGHRGGALGGRGGAGFDLEALRNSPQFAQLQQLVQQNPALLQPLIQQLTANNPALGQALADNPELIYGLLAGGAGSLGEGDLEGDEEIPPGAHVINVTPEERDAIDRLVALGFPRQAAIEAYFACGKNEELAANYLFENGFD